MSVNRQMSLRTLFPGLRCLQCIEEPPSTVHGAPAEPEATPEIGVEAVSSKPKFPPRDLITPAANSDPLHVPQEKNNSQMPSVVGNFIRQISGHSANSQKSSLNEPHKQASVDSFGRQVSGFARQLSESEVNYHTEKTKLAKDIMKKMLTEADEFDKADGSDGLAPPSADVGDSHFNRRKLANEVLAAVEDHLMAEAEEKAPLQDFTKKSRRSSCIDLGYLGEQRVTSKKVSKALEQAVKDRDYLIRAAAFGEFAQREDKKEIVVPKPQTRSMIDHGRRKSIAGFAGGLAFSERAAFSAAFVSKAEDEDTVHTKKTSVSGFVRQVSGGFVKQVSRLSGLSAPKRRASIVHDEVNHLLQTGGVGMARLTPLSHEKPVLKDPMGLQCVAHLHDRKWTKLARAIRESIYDPDFYDDGTYGPMYVRLAIHGAATWDRNDRTGGLEGAAMRYKPEYSDAHNKFCKEVLKRQEEMMKKPFPWASYADIQCLASYVALECANGPVIPFTPGRRDVIKPSELKDQSTKVEGEDFVFLNYRERGDTGCEDEPVKCPATGQVGAEGCPFMRKARVFPGRVPGPEQGHLGKPCQPVTPEMEKKEMEEVAKEIRHIFVDRIGASEQHTVALIAGGHSLGRCHPQISGYAGPWQSNPGYFNNVYCKKLLSEDWKLVDRNMEDCSGDMITGVKPYGMRRQYVSHGGKGNLMMLVSDMALREDPKFGVWIRHYAEDNEALKKDFGEAFKWITEVGFEAPAPKLGLAKLSFNLKTMANDFLKYLAVCCCSDIPGGDIGGSGGAAAAVSIPKVGNPYTMEEVKAHNSKSDCWVVINGQVCNLTEFMNMHPGGVGVIMAHAGKDASTDWNPIHSRDAVQKFAPQSVVGYVVDSKDKASAAPVDAPSAGA